MEILIDMRLLDAWLLEGLCTYALCGHDAHITEEWTPVAQLPREERIELLAGCLASRIAVHVKCSVK